MHWRKLGWSCLLLVTLHGVGASPAVGQDVNALLDQGLTNWRQGNIGGAVALFERALSAEPTNDAVLAFLQRATHLEIMRMVRSDDARVSGIGRTLLRMARTEARRRGSDPDLIARAIEEMFNADPQERLRLKITNATRFGRNLVPSLIPRLADPEIGNRVLAETLIVEIGRDAVPVLIAASDHPDARVRTAVAKMLGAAPVRHEYSVATLATMLETDADRVVQDAARASLATMIDRVGEAKQYQFNNAQYLYLNPHRNPFNTPFYEPTVYRLEGSAVVAERVLGFQVSERMAAQALAEALELDPDFQPARELKLCNEAQMLVEYEEGLALYADDAEAMEILEGQRSVMMSVVRPRLLAAGKQTLFGALGVALRDHNNYVAERLLEVIRTTARRGPAPRPVLAALLETSSRPVRVEAAVALAEWSPPDLTPAIREMVVSVLTEAMVNSGIRVAHKVMGNPENVNRFDRLFREINLESFSNSTSVEAGLVRAEQLPPDVILIDDEARSGVAQDIAPINFFVRKLRGNPRTADIPVIVVLDASRYDAQKETYEDPDAGVMVVRSDVDRVALKQGTIDPLFEEAEDAKARAVEIGVLAAGALERLTTYQSAFPVGQAVKTLEQVLLNRPDEIRIRCLGALGNLREQALGSVGVIAQLFTAAENSVEIRAAAMTAVGKILDSTSAPATAEILAIIKSGMQESNLRLRNASHFAYSAAKTPGRAILDDLRSVPAVEANEEPDADVN